MWEPIIEKWSFILDMEFDPGATYKKRIDIASEDTLNIDISDEMVAFLFKNLKFQDSCIIDLIL